MCLLAIVFPGPDVAGLPRYIAAALLALAGGGIAASAGALFRKASTSTSPTRPEQATAVVSSGIYGFTRNPMYLGQVLVLLGLAVLLWSVGAVAGLLAFIGYMTKYQVLPEERALEAKFGREYQEYKRRVRRWI